MVEQGGAAQTTIGRSQVIARAERGIGAQPVVYAGIVRQALIDGVHGRLQLRVRGVGKRGTSTATLAGSASPCSQAWAMGNCCTSSDSTHSGLTLRPKAVMN